MLLNYIQSMCPVLVSTCWSSAVTVAVWRRRARAGGRASATAAGRWAEGAALAIKGVLLFSGSIRTRLALASALWPPTESATRARPAASYCRPITTATRPTTTKHISNSNNSSSCNGPITRPAAEISSRRGMQLPDEEEGVALRATAARPACNVAASHRRRRVAPPAALITTGPRSKFHLNNNNYWIVIECLRLFLKTPTEVCLPRQLLQSVAAPTAAAIALWWAIVHEHHPVRRQWNGRIAHLKHSSGSHQLNGRRRPPFAISHRPVTNKRKKKKNKRDLPLSPSRV